VRIFISVVFAALTVMTVASYAKSTKETVMVIRLNQKIKDNVEIKENMLIEVSVGKFGLPANVIKDKSQIIGKYSATVILPDDNLVPDKFKDVKEMEDAFLYGITGERRAVSISIKSLAAGLSGKLLPGDVVSVVAFIKNRDVQQETLGHVQVYPELRYVEVGAINNSKAQDTNQLKAKDEKERNSTDTIIPATITLLVDDIQATKLIEAENTGTIHIIFAGRGDEAKKLLSQNGMSLPLIETNNEASEQGLSDASSGGQANLPSDNDNLEENNSHQSIDNSTQGLNSQEEEGFNIQ
jgi:pilus assembly protein CpaB